MFLFSKPSLNIHVCCLYIELSRSKLHKTGDLQAGNWHVNCQHSSLLLFFKLPTEYFGWLLIFSLLTPLRLNSFSSGSKKPTCQNTQLFTWHLPLCSKPRLHHWRTSYFLWPNYDSLQSLLLSHSSTSLYPALPWFVNCLCYCYAKLDYCNSLNSLSLNYPVSSRSRTLLLVLSWKLPSHVISLLSYDYTQGSPTPNANLNPIHSIVWWHW